MPFFMAARHTGSTSKRGVHACFVVDVSKGVAHRAAGSGPMASQSITSILSKAFESGVTDIPFHRIVYADGHIWVNDVYRAKRLALYKKEGIHLDKHDRIENFGDVLYEFN